jgi:hypothetical protein
MTYVANGKELVKAKEDASGKTRGRMTNIE